jgi:hypothetical protein
MNIDENVAAHGNCHLEPDFRLYQMLVSRKRNRNIITNANKDQI